MIHTVCKTYVANCKCQHCTHNSTPEIKTPHYFIPLRRCPDVPLYMYIHRALLYQLYTSVQMLAIQEVSIIITERVSMRQLLRVVFSRYAYVSVTRLVTFSECQLLSFVGSLASAVRADL